MFKMCHGCTYLNLRNRLYTYSRQQGMMLLETILIALFLGSIAVGATYFFTQTKATMSSSSQAMECQTIVRQALENTVSLGVRLYAYRINNSNSDLQYNPLFIKGSGSNVLDVGDGSYLGRGASKFPPEMYRGLFTNLVGMPTPSSRSHPLNSSLNPEENSRVPIIRNPVHPTGLFELGTTALLINSVNALQYLYNADSAYFDVGNSSRPKSWLGKRYEAKAMSSGMISEILGKYEKRFNLENVELYIRIVPIDLKTGELITSYSDIKCQKIAYTGTVFNTQDYSCPRASGHTLILTRPHLSAPSDPNLRDQIARDLVLVGNENIGFEVKVHLKYENSGGRFSCDALHRFNHQNKMITGKLGEGNPLSVRIAGLRNGAGRNLLNSNRRQTSCDQVNGTNEPNYKNITLDLDFNGFRRSGSGEEFGTVVLCKGKVACRSDGDGIYPGCTVRETMWQRCHNLRFPDQNGYTNAELFADDKLRLTFNDLTENRRYDFFITEVSMLEWSKRSVELAPNTSQANTGISGIKTVRFYIDAIRAQATSHTIPGDDVGEPNNKGVGGRDYLGPLTAWQKPLNSLSNKWLQCNTSEVDFKTNVIDQFTHNLKPCVYTGSRRNGNGTIDTTNDIKNQTFDRPSQLNHPVQCTGKLTNINHGRQTISAEPQDTCGPGIIKDLVWDTDLPGTFAAKDVTSQWFFNTSKIPYAIDTEVPASNLEGTFPKHYSVDCVEREYGLNVRTDGNGGTISCGFVNGNVNRDDGCNPEKAGIKYYHACGANQCKGGSWGVFSAYGKSCKNVQCEPGLICCDGFKGECGTVSKGQCERSTYSSSCSNPKGGGRDQQDKQAGCPPLGLYKCSYQIPCYATRPYPKTEACASCIGKRNRNRCSFKRKFICQVQGPNIRSDNNFTGICMTDGAQKPTCNNIKSSCSNWEAYSVTKQCPGGTSCTETHYRCSQYTASGGICEVTFEGQCGGAISGGCLRLGVGGGNTSNEKCDVRNPKCRSYLWLAGTGPSDPPDVNACNVKVVDPIPPPAPSLPSAPSSISCTCPLSPVTTFPTTTITTVTTGPTTTTVTTGSTTTTVTTQSNDPKPVCGPSSPHTGGTCRVGRSTDCHCSTSTACSYLCISGRKRISCPCFVSDR